MPNADQIHLQARETGPALGAMTPLTTVTWEAMDQLQLDEAWEQIRQNRENLERRDLALTQRRTVVMEEEYNIGNRKVEFKKEEAAVMQNCTILKQDWAQQELAWKEKLTRREAEWEWQEQLRKEQNFREIRSAVTRSRKKRSRDRLG